MTAGDGFTGNSRNTMKIAESERNARALKATVMTQVKAFGRRDRLMIQTAKATLLVTALARFTAIALRAGSKRLSRMVW
jgi:hypothetical protein